MKDELRLRKLETSTSVDGDKICITDQLRMDKDPEFKKEYFKSHPNAVPMTWAEAMKKFTIEAENEK